MDAILVQDMSVLRMAIPPLPLHASTQTDNRTAEKVRWLQQLGFKRVVLARELSVSEIAAIHQEVPDMPLEVLCMVLSVSGIADCVMRRSIVSDARQTAVPVPSSVV